MVGWWREGERGRELRVRRGEEGSGYLGTPTGWNLHDVGTKRACATYLHTCESASVDTSSGERFDRAVSGVASREEREAKGEHLAGRYNILAMVSGRERRHGVPSRAALAFHSLFEDDDGIPVRRNAADSSPHEARLGGRHASAAGTALSHTGRSDTEDTAYVVGSERYYAQQLSSSSQARERDRLGLYEIFSEVRVWFRVGKGRKAALVDLVYPLDRDVEPFLFPYDPYITPPPLSRPSTLLSLKACSRPSTETWNAPDRKSVV